jgi:hypothetical protein
MANLSNLSRNESISSFSSSNLGILGLRDLLPSLVATLLESELKPKPNIISNPSHIASARRVGKGDVKNNRMVIVTFTLPEVKFDLFKYRTELRNCGIRISNDLSFSQRQQLKELNQRGWSGYFKNGTLIKRAKIVKRVYKSAVRPSDRLVTDVSTPMETIQEIDDSDDGVHGPP